MNDESVSRETVESPAVWPQRFDTKYLLIALVAVGCAVGGLAFAWSAGSSTGAIGFSGFGAVCLGLAWLAVRQAGFRWIKLSPRVVPCAHSEFGSGVRIGPESLALQILIVTLGSCAVYYASVVAAVLLGQDSLLPEVREVLPNTLFAGVCGVAMGAIALLLLLFRPSTGLEIYQDVVIRTVGRSRIVRIGGDVTLRWDSITDVADEVRLNHVGLWTTREPLIRLVTSGSVPREGRLGWDTDDYLQLPVSWMAAEPNTVLAVLRAMVGNSEKRREILLHDPKKAFTPPSLKVRLRGG